MYPKAPAEDGGTADLDMFRHQLDNMIDLRHLLARLTRSDIVIVKICCWTSAAKEALL